MQVAMDIDSQEYSNAPQTASQSNGNQSQAPRSSPQPPVLQHGAGPLPSTVNGAKPRTAYIYDPYMLQHRAGPNSSDPDHPEAPARIKAIFDILTENLLIPKMLALGSRWATKEEILLVHSVEHWNKVEALKGMDGDAIRNSNGYYDRLSLYISQFTADCSRVSAGCTIEAALAVARGDVSNSIAIVRPPGHHAEPEEHMGFCFYNNVAIAARVVQEETAIKRILILDWDVHHGNGTQRAFYDNSSILYISLHRFQHDFYPSTNDGAMEYCGIGPGLGKNVNIPWPEPGMGDADYLYAFMKIVLPIVYEFAPELVMISAGFDAAEGDDLGMCKVTPAGYAHMTQMLMTFAGGKVVAVLEGGYNVASISKSFLAVTQVLLGNPAPSLPPLTATEVATEAIWQVSRVQSKYWKGINPKSLEPSEEEAEDVIPIPELLKLHRSEYMFKTHKMWTIPLAIEGLQEAYNGQLICSQDLYKKKTLLVFLHDFGNIRAELATALDCDLNMEHSYLIDASRRVVEWAHEEGWALLDINVFPKPRATKKELVPVQEVLKYVWDNYVELCDAEEVILVSHGSAVRAMIELLSLRAVTKKVKAIVQIVGMTERPLPARGSDLLVNWYKTVSLVALPASHSIFLEKKSLPKRHGVVKTYDSQRVTRLFTDAMPDIQQFARSRLVAGGNAGVSRNGDEDGGRAGPSKLR